MSDRKRHLVLTGGEESLLDRMTKRLEKEACVCHSLRDPDDAFRFLAAHPETDLLIAVISDAGLTGEKLVRSLRRKKLRTPFILAAAPGMEEQALRMLRKGAGDFLLTNSHFLENLPIAVKSVFRELKLRKKFDQVQQDLELKNATVHAICEFSPNAILAVDSEKQIIECNTPFLNLFGLSPDTLPGNALELLKQLPLTRAQRSMFQTVYGKMKSDYRGLLIPRFTVNSRAYELYTTPVIRKDDPGVPFCGRIWYLREITAHLKAREKLRAAKLEAEQHNEERNRLFAMISHDIKSPLASVAGFTQLLSEPNLTSGEKKEYLSTIRSDCFHMLSLVQDILDFSKMEGNDQEILMPNPEKMELRKALEEICRPFQPTAQLAGIELNCELAEDLPEFLITDPAHFNRVISNLLGNAVKFTHRGGVTLRAFCAEDREHLILEVQDTGIGIPKDVRQIIFEPYLQASFGIRKNYGGTGLGLAIVRKIVQTLQGEIELESEEGHGSIFRITLPAYSEVPPGV